MVGGVQVIGIKVGAKLGCFSDISGPVASKPFSVRTCLDTLTFDLILVKLDQKQEFLIHEKLCTPL
ncbi:hypothetical protein FEZ51_05435 [Pediococcus stilesii]|uniref:Uncharacterized protein n=1 Tax=Pediococcus stilesii TaxID=331679 RepID=A0A5R9BWW0_9LACO|nr:hypothetical protein FEZ51_05435 [Pediococcus stilesii]